MTPTGAHRTGSSPEPPTTGVGDQDAVAARMMQRLSALSGLAVQRLRERVDRGDLTPGLSDLALLVTLARRRQDAALDDEERERRVENQDISLEIGEKLMTPEQQAEFERLAAHHPALLHLIEQCRDRRRQLQERVRADIRADLIARGWTPPCPGTMRRR